MPHIRTQIRHGIAQALTGLATTGSKVYPSRMFSLAEDQLPSISVYTTDDSSPEAISNASMGNRNGPPRLQRLLPLIIEGHAMVDDQVDDVLDQIALEVEVAMAAPFNIGAQHLPMKLTSSQTILSDDGESQVGVVRLVYAISYSTLENSPDSL